MDDASIDGQSGVYQISGGDQSSVKDRQAIEADEAAELAVGIQAPVGGGKQDDSLTE